MPYSIQKRGDKWAVTTPSGKTVGTHTKKNDAIQQMVAVSLKEGIKPGGEKK
jgi:hypothetical protein